MSVRDTIPCCTKIFVAPCIWAWLRCSTCPHDIRNKALVSEAERIIGLYRHHAQALAQNRGDRLIETAWLDHFINLLPSRATVLDLGCGSGRPIDRYLTEHGCKITGVDSSPEIIAMCKDALAGVEWVVADMRALSLGQTFDGVLAWDSFFHLNHDDQRRMFSTVRQHAAPQAVLMFTSGPRDGEAIGSYKGEPLYHASLDPEEYRRLLTENGFQVEAHVN